MGLRSRPSPGRPLPFGQGTGPRAPRKGPALDCPGSELCFPEAAPPRPQRKPSSPPHPPPTRGPKDTEKTLLCPGFFGPWRRESPRVRTQHPRKGESRHRRATKSILPFTDRCGGLTLGHVVGADPNAYLPEANLPLKQPARFQQVRGLATGKASSFLHPGPTAHAHSGDAQRTTEDHRGAQDRKPGEDCTPTVLPARSWGTASKICSDVKASQRPRNQAGSSHGFAEMPTEMSAGAGTQPAPAPASWVPKTPTGQPQACPDGTGWLRSPVVAPTMASLSGLHGAPPCICVCGQTCQVPHAWVRALPVLRT